MVSMSRSETALIGICLVACLGGALYQYHGIERLRAPNISLRAKASALQKEIEKPAVSEELERLWQSPVEVLHLRGKVETLRSEIQKAGSAPRTPADVLPREQFYQAGYGDFFSAYRSAIAHLMAGNVPGYLNSFTPERGEAEREMLDYDMKTRKRTEAEIGAVWAKEFADFAGVRIISTNWISSNVVSVQIQAYLLDGRVTRPSIMKIAQTGEAWKLMVAPFWDR